MQLQALNHSVLMSKRQTSFARSVDAMSKNAKCNTSITREVAHFKRILQQDRVNAHPVETCIDMWVSDSSRRKGLLSAAHKEAAAGFYVDEFGGFGCTITFSAHSNYSQAPECAASKYVLPSPTPSSTPSTTPTISVTASPPNGMSTTKTFSATPSTSASAIPSPPLSPSKTKMSSTLNALPSPFRKVVIPENMKTHRFKNKQIMYKMENDTKSLLELKCPGDCTYCILKDEVYWCFSAYFTVYIDIYVTTK